MDTAVLVSKHGQGITILTLNRPQAANALSMQMLRELQAAIEGCKSDPVTRCVIIVGAGDTVFCAGADLKERAAMNDLEARDAVELIGDTINGLEALPKPVIAAINGAAFGGGLELALACDIRIASETANLGLTETSLGILPGAGGTQRLPRLVGKGRAKELIYTARRIGAEEALNIGLVEYVTPAYALMGTTIELAEKIVRNAPIAIAQAKYAIDKGLDADIHTGLAIERQAYEVILPTKDRLEGLQAFKEKRHPVFKGE
ncbi:enoyl-CoA hydratase [Paenibacillus sediminis]|uniref:Enoyl-CoA hydratase/carnithine racemase n=1 Tax=Paenibacillus sediminis TaxID=664909 RepID=A0ABS4H4Y9_9BACL|nr:enoyl-CoA hydratase [Paenibacillus sediminis]MBP1937592.1 enoyl-CoA hydratase/carnithine racemase [Paenibacillus sediminis]